jgi:hypothetical protein
LFINPQLVLVSVANVSTHILKPIVENESSNFKPLVMFELICAFIVEQNKMKIY